MSNAHTISNDHQMAARGTKVNLQFELTEYCLTVPATLDVSVSFSLLLSSSVGRPLLSPSAMMAVFSFHRFLLYKPAV